MYLESGHAIVSGYFGKWRVYFRRHIEAVLSSPGLLRFSISPPKSSQKKFKQFSFVSVLQAIRDPEYWRIIQEQTVHRL